MRRGATLERCGHTPTFSRRYATPRADGCRHRGLKPTATGISSLRDDVGRPKPNERCPNSGTRSCSSALSRLQTDEARPAPTDGPQRPGMVTLAKLSGINAEETSRQGRKCRKANGRTQSVPKTHKNAPTTDFQPQAYQPPTTNNKQTIFERFLLGGPSYSACVDPETNNEKIKLYDYQSPNS